MRRPTTGRDARELDGGAILIVDDDEDAREVLAELLGRRGYPVVTRGNGKEALAYLGAAPAPAVILLDLDMPMMDGYELRGRQAGDRALARIPVVVMTDRRTIDLARLGELSILHKPFALEQVIAAIDQHLAPRRLRAPRTTARTTAPMPAADLSGRV